MFWVFRQLGAPIRYLTIAQGHGWLTSKSVYDWLIPIFVSSLATAVVWGLRIDLGLFNEDGLVSGVINLLNLLIAFFIAALAAVATFDRPGLDEKMKGEPAIMKRRSSNGVQRDHILTHRQFICYLFGYLSFASIALLVMLYALRLVGPEVMGAGSFVYQRDTWGLDFKPGTRLIGTYAFFLIFSQIIVTMLLGIYFLCDRLQFLDDPTD